MYDGCVGGPVCVAIIRDLFTVIGLNTRALVPSVEISTISRQVGLMKLITRMP